MHKTQNTNIKMEQFNMIETKVFRGMGFINIIKYNNAGNLIYVGDKDSKTINAIDTINYEVVGMFHGHLGVVWNIDISQNDQIMISCSGDLSICFWNTIDGTLVFKSLEKCVPKYLCVQKKSNGCGITHTNLVGVICEAITKKTPTYIKIFDIDNLNSEGCVLEWNRNSKPNVLTWLNNTTLIIGCDDGKIVLRNIEDLNGLNESEFQIHKSAIKSIVWNKSQSQILTGSIDCEAKCTDINTWNVISTYTSSVPINWACWNHNDRKILIGGGIEAMNVAKTSNNDLNLKIFRVQGQKLTHHLGSHFGPIRYIDKSPIGKNYASASQDGTAKIYIIKDEENGPEEHVLKQNVAKQDICSNYDEYKYFGMDPYTKIILLTETNKMENLSWKSKTNTNTNIEKKIANVPVYKSKWIPGMPKPNNNSENCSKSSATFVSDDNVYKIGSMINSMDKMVTTTNFSEQTNNDNTYKINSLDDINEKIKKFNQHDSHSNSNIYANTVRVTNLPPDITKKDLVDLFDIYGRIVDGDGIKIKHYENSFDKTTMAFVKYMYEESASKAVGGLDGYVLNHYLIRVEMSRPNR